MGIGMTKVLHVKIPVTDLACSVEWYAALMDLVLTREFIEGGELRGVALSSPEGGFAFALRERAHCSSTPMLEGFDIVALHMATRESLVDLRRRCGELGVPCSPIEDRAHNEAVLDVADPDGTVLRFYWVGDDGQPDHFVGIEFDDAGPPRLVYQPRLQVAPRVGRAVP